MADTLTIDAFSLITPGEIAVRDTTPLLDVATRGELVQIPGVAGLLGVPQLLTGLPVDLNLEIFGTTRVLAVAKARTVATTICVPAVTADGTRTLAANIAGVSYGGAVMVHAPLHIGAFGPDYLRAVLRLTVLAGRLT